MKNIFFIAIIFILYTLSSCSIKDKGNYDYVDVARPVVTGLNAEYSVLLGEVLKIKPTVTIAGTKDFSFQWKVLTDSMHVTTGDSLKFSAGTVVGVFSAKLILTNNVNGAKYIYPFTIKSATVFSQGVMVLSDEGGVAQLSFVKPDNSVMPRIYKTMNGKDLPGAPLQLVGANFYWGMQYYWVLCSSGYDPGVKLDPNTLATIRTVRSNFIVPETGPIQLGNQIQLDNGSALFGVMNNKLAAAYSIGYAVMDPYGMWGDGYLTKGDGAYKLGGSFIYVGYQYMYGYDENARKFIKFQSNGGWVGDDYVVPTPAGGGALPFDPKNVGMSNVLFMSLIGTTHFAFCKNDAGNVFEYQFLRSGGTKDTITPTVKRAFAGSSIVKANSKWLSSVTNEFFISSDDKIYRYNRITTDLTALTATFNGDKITMMKFADPNTLMVGVQSGKIYFLDISLGVNGVIKPAKTIQGIPGAPVDAYVRTS